MKADMNLQFDYDELSNRIIDSSYDDSEQRALSKRRLSEIYKEERKLAQEKIALCMSLSDPEAAIRLVNLTTKAARTIMQNELTMLNIDVQPYSEFTEEDQEFFDAKKYKIVRNLHAKVLNDNEVSKGVDLLKQEGTVDARKIRHKKKPSDYLGSLANSKLLRDLALRQKAQEERLAKLELSQQQNEERFNQIGNCLLDHDAKLNKIEALRVLGVDDKKIELYNLAQEQPELTRNQLALLIGKSKPTVIAWLKEVKTVIDSSKS